MKNIIVSLIVILVQDVAFSQFNPVAINWSTPTDAYFTNSPSSILESYGTIDINGDNKPDFVRVTSSAGNFFGTPGNRYWEVYLNNGLSYNTNPLTWSVPFNTGALSYQGFGIGNDRYATFDINGDNKADLVRVVIGGSSIGTPGNRYWEVYINNGSGFNATPINWATPFDAWLINYQGSSGGERFSTIDMDGDQKPDLIRMYSGGALLGTAGNRYWEVFKNNGAGFDTNPLIWSTPFDAGMTNSQTGNERYATIDMNGDAKPDLIRITSGGNLFGASGNRYWEVYLNNGSSFNTNPSPWSTPIDAWKTDELTGGSSRYSTFDINGDNKPDFVVLANNSSLFGTSGNRYWEVYYNNNNSFISSPYVWSTPFDAWNTSMQNGTERYAVIDMNGDDKPDMIRLTFGDNLFGPPGSRYWEAYLSTVVHVPERQDVLSSLKIYPNPYSENVFVEISESASYEITDATGRLIKNGFLAQGKNDILLNDLKKGIYFLRVSTDQKHSKNIKLLKSN